MRNTALLLPESFTSFSFRAKSSLESSLPSGVKTQNQLAFVTRGRMASASFSSPAAISAGLGFSGRRLSGSSSRVKRQ